MNNIEINAKVAEIRKLEAEAELLKQQVDALRDELKAELDVRKVDNVNTGLFNITYRAVSQKRADSAKLKAAGIFDIYSKETTSLRFQITDVKIV